MSISPLHVSVLRVLALLLISGPLNLSFSKMALFPEDPCNEQGGQCLKKADCPEGKLAPLGLCPEQQKMGVECCNGLSMERKDCNSQGGRCTSSFCNPDLQVSSSDCKYPEVCCVLAV